MLLLEKPLTGNELQSLDHFLRHRSSAKNRLNLTHTHGFLCAVITAPTLHANYYALLMDKAVGAVNQFVQIDNDHNLWLSRLMHQITYNLQQNTFSPLLFDDSLTAYENASWELIKEWCQGYLRGVGLDPVWVKNDHAIITMMPIGILADEFDLIGLPDAHNQPIQDNMPHKILARKHLPISIAELYDYWEEQRTFYRELNKNLH